MFGIRSIVGIVRDKYRTVPSADEHSLCRLDARGSFGNVVVGFIVRWLAALAGREDVDTGRNFIQQSRSFDVGALHRESGLSIGFWNVRCEMVARCGGCVVARKTRATAVGFKLERRQERVRAV
jgi:hypothetical protein